METTNLRQRILIRSNAETVYGVLLDETAFAEISGMTVSIEATEGGAFAWNGGTCQGRIIKLEQGQLIVLAWRRDDWGVDEYSVASFRLQDLKDRTQLIFSHGGLPAHSAKDVRQMWYNIWQQLKKRYQGEEPTPATAGKDPGEPSRDEPAPVTSDA